MCYAPFQIILYRLIWDFKDLKFGRSRSQNDRWSSGIAEEFDEGHWSQSGPDEVLICCLTVLSQKEYLVQDWFITTDPHSRFSRNISEYFSGNELAISYKICCYILNHIQQFHRQPPVPPVRLVSWWLSIFSGSHDDVIKWKHFPRYWSFVRGIHAELWCFIWSVPEQIVEQTIETPVVWDAITLIMTSL